MHKPPEGYKPRRGFAWCPYCGAEKRFLWDARLGVARCAGCRISSWDFYVRVLNGLAGDAAMENFGRAVRRRRI